MNSFSLRFNGHFSGKPGLASVYWSKGCGGDNWTTGAISRAKLQSNHYHQQTNIQFFTGWMPILSPNQQCQALKGKYHIPWTFLTQAHLGSSNFCLWPLIAPGYLGGGLPLAMPLISPLMPLPQISNELRPIKISLAEKSLTNNKAECLCVCVCLWVSD